MADDNKTGVNKDIAELTVLAKCVVDIQALAKCVADIGRGCVALSERLSLQEELAKETTKLLATTVANVKLLERRFDSIANAKAISERENDDTKPWYGFQDKV